MAIAYNASAVSSGLVFQVDAANANSYSPSPAGYWSGLFNGTSNFLEIPANAAFDFGAGNWTVECWFYLTGDAALNNGSVRDAVLFSVAGAIDAPQLTFCVNILGNASTTGTGIQVFKNSNISVNMQRTATISKFVWNHVAAVKSGGNTITIYLNGVQIGATLSDATPWGGSGFNAYVSRLTSSPGWFNYFPGYISNLRVVKGTALYTANFTPSTVPLSTVSGTSLLTCQSPTFIDNSGNNFTVTGTGTPIANAFNPFLNTAFTTSLTTVQALVVAGGGAGGAGEGNTNGGGGGGGGAGGVIYSPSVPVTANTAYPVIRGNGGLQNNIAASVGANGENSSFAGLVAIGGGGGGGGDLEGGAGVVVASSGGSGGGAGGDVTSENQAAGTAGQGNAGGAKNGPNNNRAGAGGGGAGQAGSSGTRGINNTGLGGNGGNGVSYDISGTATFYGGGGGGGASVNFSSGTRNSSGGLGGGGAGGGETIPFTGTNFTGGGGGGGFGSSGGGGGSGIVIIRYPGGPRATGGDTITSLNGDTIHTFQQSGTFTTLTSAQWRDISGRGINGVCVNTPVLNGANGGSLVFNGSTQYVDCGANSALDVGNNITVNAWFYVGSNAVYQPIAAKNNQAGTLGWEIANSSGAFRATLRPGGLNITAGALTVGVWYMGTMTFDGTTMRLYVNGTETGNATGGTSILNSTQSLLLSSRANGVNFFNGYIAQVSIYNRALSAAEITQNFNALRGRFGI